MPDSGHFGLQFMWRSRRNFDHFHPRRLGRAEISMTFLEMGSCSVFFAFLRRELKKVVFERQAY